MAEFDEKHARRFMVMTEQRKNFVWDSKYNTGAHSESC